MSTAKTARSLLMFAIALAVGGFAANSIATITNETHGKLSVNLTEKFTIPVAACVSGIAWSPDSSVLAVSSNKNQTLAAFDKTGHWLSQFRNLGNTINSRYSLAFVNGASQVLFTADYPDKEDAALEVRDRVSGKIVRTLPGPKADIFAVSPDQKRVAFTGGKAIITYDAQSWKLLSTAKIDYPKVAAGSLSFFADSKLLAVGMGTFVGGKTVDVIDSTSGAVVKELGVQSPKSNPLDIDAIAVSPQGDLVLTGVNDETVRVLQISDGTQTAMLRTPKSGVEFGQAVWDPKGRFAAFVDGRSLVIWQPKAGKDNFTRYRFSSPPKRGFALSIGKFVTMDPSAGCAVLVTMAQDGKSLAVAHGDGVTVYNVEDNIQKDS